MRILVISRRDMHMNESGGARTVTMLNDYLAARPGVEVYTSYRNLGPVDPRVRELPIGMHTASEINRLIREYNIDILLAPEGVYFARMAREAVRNTRCKVVTELHTCPGYEEKGLWIEVRESFRQSASLKAKGQALLKILTFPVYKMLRKHNRRGLFQAMYTEADAFVVLVNSFIEEYRSYYRLQESSRMRAIPNALSFEKEISFEEFAQKEKIILVVARLDEYPKRISLILKAWKQIEAKYPDWRLQLVGDGNDMDRYRQTVEAHGLQRVDFEGRQSSEPYYIKSSIFVMTSAFEGCPMTITEAQQKGCVPVVMDSFSAVHDLIEDGANGFIVNNGDLSAFTDRIEWLINHPDELRQMGNKGVQTSRRFDMERHIGPQWVELFNGLTRN